MLTRGAPKIREINESELAITQPLGSGGRINITCREKLISCDATNASGGPLTWEWELLVNEQMIEVFHGTTTNTVEFESTGTKYRMQLLHGSVRSSDDGTIRLICDDRGVLVLNLSAD